MTPEQFVSALRQVVLEAAVVDILNLLERPPGRRPRAEIVEASKWYGSLGPDDRKNLAQVLGILSHQVLFGTLAVLDGARSVEGSGEKGHFKLVFRKGDQEWELAGPKTPPLHEIL